MNGQHSAGFERCMSVGGVAVFGADTVYGLACDVHNPLAVARLYALKRRRPAKPSAVMFFDVSLAVEALPELGPRTLAALERLLPGAVTVLLPNPELRYPLACGEDQLTLGLRVPVLAGLEGVKWPVLQSSANFAGGPEAVRLEDVPEPIRRRADMVIDGGELPGTASTVIDLRAYEADGDWRIARSGAVGEAEIRAALEWQFHFHPETYASMIREDLDYDRLQDELARASGTGARRVLELGTGTGETAERLLARHLEAELVGIDESSEMLAAARSRLPPERISLRVARLQAPLPEGPFDLVASALCVHHLRGPEKQDLFGRVRERLAPPGGRFALADLVIPADPADAVSPLTPGFDHPSPLDDQLAWLAEAGFETRVAWAQADLAVVVADAR